MPEVAAAFSTLVAPVVLAIPLVGAAPDVFTPSVDGTPPVDDEPVSSASGRAGPQPTPVTRTTAQNMSLRP